MGWVRTIVAILTAFLVATGCAKEGKKGERDGKKGKGGALEVPTTEVIWATQKLEDQGYRVVRYEAVFATKPATKGRIMLYRAAKGEGGGLLYFLRRKDERVVGPLWHFYFPDRYPTKVERVESNEDGLWDLQVTFSDGSQRLFLHDRDFTFYAPERKMWMACNVEASSHAEGSPFWKALDGDTNTAWLSAGSSEAEEVTLRFPFGVIEGILEMRVDPNTAPRKVEVLKDGEVVANLSVEAAGGLQRFRLPPSLKGARELTLRFHGGDRGTMGVVELKME
jgi:hypothetical protein